MSHRIADRPLTVAPSLPRQVNPEYLSVNWESGGGGAFAVIPLNERGKLPDQIPLFRGHTAAVLDTDWCVGSPRAWRPT